MPEPIFMELDVHIMAPEPISAAYFIDAFVSLCACISIRAYCCQATAQKKCSGGKEYMQQ
jgi:hypothetical protein